MDRRSMMLTKKEEEKPIRVNMKFENKWKEELSIR